MDGMAEEGSVDIDPYARATIARTGELPVGPVTASPSTPIPTMWGMLSTGAARSWSAA